MFKLISLVIIALLTKETLSFTWSDCGLRNATVHFKNMTLAPSPIRFAEPALFSGAIKLDEDILEGSRTRTTIWRVVKVFWTWPVELRVGCVGDFGSCSRDLCERVQSSDHLCKLMKSSNATCECPVLARSELYRSKGIHIEMPGSMAFSFFARVSCHLLIASLSCSLFNYERFAFQGLYKYRMQIVNAKQQEMGCIQGTFNLY